MERDARGRYTAAAQRVLVSLDVLRLQLGDASDRSVDPGICSRCPGSGRRCVRDLLRLEAVHILPKPGADRLRVVRWGDALLQVAKCPGELCGDVLTRAP